MHWADSLQAPDVLLLHSFSSLESMSFDIHKLGSSTCYRRRHCHHFSARMAKVRKEEHGRMKKANIWQAQQEEKEDEILVSVSGGMHVNTWKFFLLAC
ncbi:hypothetical protein OPV22_005552 [Ensete ventricosum]|uniref:Uncharacterized protein n=1 Tax=Ensete ventricosum TaxID=4639 RepID=A0AAV8RIR7_ENSVE|nr:hypothetical protein OPV22_005552 [Ensete ventricosum]